MISLSLDPTHETILAARSRRLGQSIEEMTRYVGHEHLVRQECDDIRTITGNPMLGGDPLVTAIVAEADRKAALRSSGQETA